MNKPNMEVAFTACVNTHVSACPKVGVDKHCTDPMKPVVITDDFEGSVRMSREQFSLIVQAAKAGKFDNMVS
jgi:hypothetical protein